MLSGLKSRLLVASLLLAFLALIAPSATAASKSFGERLSEWLNEPGVRVVVVEFYSDYCEPCKEAAPAWERLRKRYDKAGLRLVVINIDDVENLEQCKKLPWSPWKALCKPELAQELGVNKVPQSFIWS
jgi:thiol-disulfide isomerase/thioredoxin